MRLTQPVRYGLLTFAAGLAILLHIWLTPYAFPTASLRMRVFSNDAARLAEQFLRREHITIPASYRQAVNFDVRENAKAYLEQTLGMRRANQVMQSEGCIYYWTVRWFRPEEEEEYYVDVTPDGRIIGYLHIIPNDDPAVKSAHAEEVARAFLARTADLTLAGYTLHRSVVTPRAHRQDITFVWERRDTALGTATQCIRVTVTGNRVIRFDRYLRVPEAFAHRYATERQRGESLASVAFALMAVFYIAGLVAVILGISRRAFSWRSGLAAAMLVTLVLLLNHVNELPLLYAYFDVTYPWVDFWTKQALAIATEGLCLFLFILLLVGAAEWFYRHAFPAHRPLFWWFSRAGLASRPGRQRLLIGLWLIPMQLAFVSLFYFLAERYLHGWMPAASRYDDLFGTAMPWAYALLIGVQAAVFEEFLFRVLAISWLRRVVKHDWLAVLIPALIWGFAHCNYPNQPFYIRGIELTLWGIVFGFVFLRYGPLPTLIAHAGYNAVLVGGSFLSSVTWLPRLHFGVVLSLVLLPLLLSLWWSRHAPPDEEDELPDDNQGLSETMQQHDRHQRQPLPVPETESPIPPLPRHAWHIGLALLLAGIITAGVASYFTQDTGDASTAYRWRASNTNPLHGRLIDRREAVRLARRALAREGARVDGWVMSAVALEGGWDDDDKGYLEQYLSEDDAVALGARLPTPALLWEVSWQKPLARERWEVRVTAEGAVWDVYHRLPEEAPGARLAPAQARALAEAALAQRGYPLNHLHLAGTDAKKLPHRDSYIFTWDMPGLRVGEALLTLDVCVDGDRVNWIGSSVKVPDSYTFDEETQPLWETIGQVLAFLLVVVFIIWGGVTLFALLREYRIPWAWGFRAAGICGVLVAVLLWQQLARDWAGLNSTVSPAAFLMRILLTKISVLTGVVVLIVVLVPVVIALWQDGVSHLPGPRTWLQTVCVPWRYTLAWRDALLAQFPLAGIVLLVIALVDLATKSLSSAVNSAASPGVQIPAWLLNMQPLLRSYDHTDPFSTFATLDVSYPVLFFVLIILLVGAACLLGWLALIAFGKRLFHTRRRALAWLAMMLVITVLASSEDWSDVIEISVTSLLVLLAAWTGYRLFLRTNPLAVFVSMVTILSGIYINGLLWFPAYRPAAFIIGALLATAYGWALVSAVLAARNAHRRPPPLTTAPPAEECMVADAGQ